MTLPELCSILLIVTLGVLGCLWFAALVGVLCLVLLGGLLMQIEAVMTGRPYWPVCRGCPRDRYRFDWAHGRWVARCDCGESYVRRGRQCLRLLSGGATRPFMRWRPLCGWVREDAPAESDPRTPYREDHESAR